MKTLRDTIDVDLVDDYLAKLDHLSPSSIATWMKCGLQHYYGRMVGIK